jgi:hypothetical protein
MEQALLLPGGCLFHLMGDLILLSANIPFGIHFVRSLKIAHI